MITFKEIAEANKSIGTTSIKGKNYAEVNQRVKAFRMVWPNGTIETNMLSNENGVCVFRAYVKDDEGRLLATGTAYENEKSSFINKTSYIENCETSAVGRALGMCGLGIDTSICSSEELQNAINNQNAPKEKEVDKLQTAINYQNAPKEKEVDKEEQEKKANPEDLPIDKNHWFALQAMCKQKGVDVVALMKKYGFKKASEIPFGKWKIIMRILEMQDAS